MNGFRLQPARLGHALGRAPRRRRQKNARLHFLKHADDGIQNGRLAGAGAAGEHHDLGRSRRIHGLLLLFGERHGHGFEHLLHQLFRLGKMHGLRRMQKPVHIAGYLGLVNMVSREVDAFVVAEILDDHALLSLEFRYGLVRHVGRNGKLVRRLLHQKIPRIVDMPVFGKTHEHVEHAGLGSQGTGLVEAQLAGQCIGRGEAYAVYIHGQPVGIFPHHGKSLRTVLTIDAHRKTGRHAVRLQEDHKFPNSLMLRPRRLHGLQPFFAEAGKLQHTVRVVIHHFQGIRPEMRHNAVGPFRPYALDAAGSKEKTDALFRGGKFLFPRGHLYLAAELRMTDPVPLYAQAHAGLGRRHGAHNGHRILPSFHAQPEHRPAVFLVMENHALQRAGKFLRLVGPLRGQHIHLFHQFITGLGAEKGKAGQPTCRPLYNSLDVLL